LALNLDAKLAHHLGVKWPAGRLELDAMVVNVELTLASIIQGVALFFLTDNARLLLGSADATAWPYIIQGLLIIFVFWSRSIIHTFTLIRWPIEFPHNFFYIACALGEALLFTHLADPLAWFRFSAFYAVIVWLLFIYDLRIIKTREKDSAGEASCQLYTLVRRDQWMNILVLMPLVFAGNFASAWCIRRWPIFYLARHGHLWLIGLQIAAFAIYLIYVGRFFTRLVPLIAESRNEWTSDENG
jgi:hypothetical protein